MLLQEPPTFTHLHISSWSFTRILEPHHLRSRKIVKGRSAQ